MADPNLTELATTTLRKRSKKTADNVSKGNALLSLLNSNGRVRSADGGRTIIEELEYAENATFKYYSGYEVLDVSKQVVFSAAEYNWKQAAVVISASGLETEVQNTGMEAAIKLLASRSKNAERTMGNNLSTGIYSDGTGTSGKQITGLQALVADDPTSGTVGGINRANFSFWANKIYDFSTESITASSTTIQAAMQNVWLSTQKGNEHADVIVAGTTYYTYFWTSLTAIQRITSTDKAISGFQSLMFLNAPVIYDGDSGLAATRMYFLNTEYLSWRPHTKRNMVPLVKRDSGNQDAIVIPLVFAGNLTMSNASRQGLVLA
jgi:hypothetical protein